MPKKVAALESVADAELDVGDDPISAAKDCLRLISEYFKTIDKYELRCFVQLILHAGRNISQFGTGGPKN